MYRNHRMNGTQSLLYILFSYYKNHNYGIISVSRNYALDRANGDWICFLDSDDSWKPNKLECLLPYIDKFDLIYHGYIQKGTNYSHINRKKILFYTVKQSCVSNTSISSTVSPALLYASTIACLVHGII